MSNIIDTQLAALKTFLSLELNINPDDIINTYTNIKQQRCLKFKYNDMLVVAIYYPGTYKNKKLIKPGGFALYGNFKCTRNLKDCDAVIKYLKQQKAITAKDIPEEDSWSQESLFDDYETNVTDNKLEETLYHGSPNTNISKLQIGIKDTNGDQYGRGIYLTMNKDEAKQYAGTDGRVYTVDIDNLKLYNTNNKLTNEMRSFIKELISEDIAIRNSICRYNRKVYTPKDNKDCIEFMNNKRQEFKKEDNKYLGNLPKVTKENGSVVVYYTDYKDIDGALDKMTVEDIHSCLQSEYNPNIFVDMIIISGYDGIITHNGSWYIIYKKEDKVKIIESKSKLEEVSRNELLSRAKSQTITRYNKSAGYKGFHIVDIDTTSVFTTNCLRVTCKVGKYWDTVELQNILFWVQIEAEKNDNRQINTKGVTKALMNSIDGMDIKVDCNCGDFIYRFAYRATKYGYKYGKPETRPAKITNPNDYGSMCKHLISMLRNKRWLQQVTSTFMDFLVDRINDVNKFLRLKDNEVLTLPNELARYNARMATYSKLFKKEEPDDEDQEVEQDDKQVDNKQVNDKNTNTEVDNNE